MGQGTVVGRDWAYELCDLVVLRGEHRVVLACDQLRHALRRAHLSAEAARRSRADILRTHIRTVSPGQSDPWPLEIHAHLELREFGGCRFPERDRSREQNGDGHRHTKRQRAIRIKRGQEASGLYRYSQGTVGTHGAGGAERRDVARPRIPGLGRASRRDSHRCRVAALTEQRRRGLSARFFAGTLGRMRLRCRPESCGLQRAWRS